MALLEEEEVATEGVRRVCEYCPCGIGGETLRGGGAAGELFIA